MNRLPRILLLIPHLGGGGAEQVMALLARGLSRGKYELHLGLITGAHTGAAALPRWVTIHPLRASRVRAGALPLLRLVRQLKPDLILSGMAHLNFLVLLLRPFFPQGVRVLVRQNATLSSALAFGGLPRSTRLLYQLLYPHADRILCQSRAMAEDLAAELAIDKGMTVALPNPVDIGAIRAAIGAAKPETERLVSEGGGGFNPRITPAESMSALAPEGCSRPISPASLSFSAAANDNAAQWPGPGPHLLAIGRLSREKGFDLLLDALASVRSQFPAADLLIAGAGPEEVALRAQSHALGLETAVRFAGFLAPPWSYFAGATLFVLSSRHEGMPNALLEAAAAGLPIVALPASKGVVDLLRGHPGVWLAPEVSAAALQSSLLAALQNLPPDARFAHPFIREFSFESAIQAYEDLIDRTLSRTALSSSRFP